MDHLRLLDHAIDWQYERYASMEPLAIRRAEVADAPYLCDVTMDTYGYGSHPLLDATYPAHSTPEGRKTAHERYVVAMKNQAACLHYLKVIKHDESAEQGKIIGYCKWQFKMPGDHVPHVDRMEGPFWPNEDERKFVSWFREAYMSRRVRAMERLGKKEALFAIVGLAVLPEHQRNGAGSLCVRWATELADRLNIKCVVESALAAETFYQKHGFVSVERVKVDLPPRWADRATQEFVWMTRNPQN